MLAKWYNFQIVQHSKAFVEMGVPKIESHILVYNTFTWQEFDVDKMTSKTGPKEENMLDFLNFINMFKFKTLWH